jgi:hypothetical protein
MNTAVNWRVGLGDKVRDTITGMEGIVVARTDWLFGCKRICIQPITLHEDKPIDALTFDERQLTVLEAGAILGYEPILPATDGEPHVRPAPAGMDRPTPSRGR